MLNITIPVVPSQPNQITLYKCRFTTRLCFQARCQTHVDSAEALRIRGTFALIYAVLLEFFYERVAFIYKKKDGFHKSGFLSDKSLFAIGIKEGPLINHSDVRECSWRGTGAQRYVRLQR